MFALYIKFYKLFAGREKNKRCIQAYLIKVIIQMDIL